MIHKIRSLVPIRYGLLGFAAGACAGCAATLGVLLVAGVGLAPTGESSPPTPAASPPTREPCQDTSGPVEESECLLAQYGQAEQAINALAPRLEELESDQDLIRAYQVLAEAEFSLNHYQLAAGYLDRLVELAPTVDHLYLLAEAYYLGGDHEHAMARYIELADWDGEEADPLRPLARSRIEDLARIMGTPTPSAVAP